WGGHGGDCGGRDAEGCPDAGLGSWDWTRVNGLPSPGAASGVGLATSQPVALAREAGEGKGRGSGRSGAARTTRAHDRASASTLPAWPRAFDERKVAGADR